MRKSTHITLLQNSYLSNKVEERKLHLETIFINPNNQFL